MLVMALLAAALGVAPAGVSAQTDPASPTPSVCDRTPAIRDAIVAARGNRACATITSAQLATIKYLGHNGITDTITALQAADFAGLTGLTYLNLSGTVTYPNGVRTSNGKLSVLPVGVFDELTALTFLGLSDNDLSVLPVGVFDELTALTTLNLYGNDLSVLPVDVFDGLIALTHLNLYGNELSSLPVGVFDGLTALRDMHLSGNELSSLPVGVFDGLTALTTLHLQYNELSSLPVGVFDELTALTTLSLYGNELSVLPVGVFDGLTALGWLELEYNELSSLPVGVLDGLTALKGLRLNNNELSVLPVGVFDGLTALRNLNLSRNELSSLPVGVFDGLTSLGWLYLTGNELSSLPVGVFDGLTALTRLTLHDNAFVEPPLVVDLVHDPVSGSVVAWATSGAPGEVSVSVTAANAVPGSFSLVVPAGGMVSEPISVTASGGGDVAFTHTASMSSDLFYIGPPLAVGGVVPDAAPSFGDQTTSEVSLREGMPSGALVLPEASGGNGLLRYSLEAADGGGLPAGLTFHRRTRTLSGTPTETGSFELIYRVQDVDGDEASLRFTVDVAGVLSFGGPPVSHQFAEVGEEYRLVLPEASGGSGEVSYRLTAASPDVLPTGLSFDAATRTLSGTPSEVSAAVLVYEATDGSGVSLAQHFSFSVFSATHDVVEVLSVCDRSREVRGAIMRALGARDCSAVTVQDLAGITDLGFLRFSDPASTGTVESLKAGDFGGLTGVTSLDLSNHRIDSLPAGVFEGLDSLTSLRLDRNGLPTLPAGAFDGLGALESLRLDHNGLTALPEGVFAELGQLETLYVSDNQLAALPDDLFCGLESLRYVYLQRNPGAPFPIEVDLDYAPLSRSLVARVSQCVPADLPVSVTAANGTPASVLLTVPGGQSQSAPVTVARSGIREVALSASVGPWPPAADVHGLSVSVPLTFGDRTIADQTHRTRAPIQSLRLPAAYGGSGELTYSLATERGELPEGFHFSATARTLFAVPQNRSGVHHFIYTATGPGGETASLRFTITVVAAPLTLRTAGLPLPGVPRISVSTATLPEGDGGEGDLTYSLREVSRSSVMRFDAETRTMSMRPGVKVYLEYTVADETGRTASVCLVADHSGAQNARSSNNLYFDLRLHNRGPCPEPGGPSGAAGFSGLARGATSSAIPPDGFAIPDPPAEDPDE